MSRRTVGRYFNRSANGGLDALLPAKAAKPKDDAERGQFLFRYFTPLRPLTVLTEPPEGWMIFAES
jgi:hypothetical protein